MKPSFTISKAIYTPQFTFLLSHFWFKMGTLSLLFLPLGLPTAMLTHHDGDGLLAFVSSNKPFLLQVVLSIVLYPSNREQLIYRFPRIPGSPRNWFVVKNDLDSYLFSLRLPTVRIISICTMPG